MLRVLNAECDQLMVMARMNVGALRCRVHLRRRRTGFSTMVGEQPWSNHPLVDLLDRTQQFIGPKANDSSHSFAEFGLGTFRLKQMFAAEIIRLELRAPPGCAKKCL